MAKFEANIPSYLKSGAGAVPIDNNFEKITAQPQNLSEVIDNYTNNFSGGIRTPDNLVSPVADKENNPYEYNTLKYWEWFLDRALGKERDPKYMGYWSVAHTADLLQKYSDAGAKLNKWEEYEDLLNEKLKKHTEHFKSKTLEDQQKWLESEKKDFKKTYDMGIIPGQPRDKEEITTPSVPLPYEQEVKVPQERLTDDDILIA
jgi:hypothetical protein